MKKHFALGHNAAHPGGHRPPLHVTGLDGGGLQRRTINDDLVLDADGRSGQCDDGLNERRCAGRAKASGQIETLARKIGGGTGRWTDEHTVTDRNRTVQRFYLPKAQRIGGREVHPIAAPCEGCRHRTEKDDAGADGRKRPALSRHRGMPRSRTWLWARVCCCARSYAATRCAALKLGQAATRVERSPSATCAAAA